MYQFDEIPEGRDPLCIVCEEMLADALDETLAPADRTWFDHHLGGCAECSAMVADAQRGAAWLDLLKTPRPEPSAMLLERILAQTQGVLDVEEASVTPHLTAAVVGRPVPLPAMTPVPVPLASTRKLLAFRPRMPQLANWSQTMFQPRLAMTAAMAFFSLALTLNLTGVRLDQVKASSLTPTGLKRSFYEANAEAVRYYDNLRVVKVMESRVEDLRDANADANALPESQQR